MIRSAPSPFLRLALLGMALALPGGCATAPPAPPPAPPVAAAVLLATPGRPEADVARDEQRRAAQTLAFIDARPGMHVIDLEAGGGYWSELMAAAVGPGGSVVLQNPAGFIPFVREALDARFASGRLPQVRQSVSPFDALEAADASADLVLWVQGPHDLFYRPDGQSLGDPEGSFREIARVLRPGGALVVIDHSAVPGSAPSSGNDLHRIDPEITIALADRAGLRLAARADFLSRPEDPRTQNVFDPAIRGRTDQHVLRFVRPRGRDAGS